MNSGLLFGIALLTSIYVLLSPKLAPYIYRPLLFHPDEMSVETKPPVLQGIEGQEVVFGREKSFKLFGWLYRQHKTPFVVLVCHGNGGNIGVRPSLIEGILQAGASVLIFDYCGYGKSEGSPDPQNVIDASICAYQYLIEKQQFKPSDIIPYGESLGAAPAAYLSANFETRGLILQSGFTSLHAIAVEKYPFLNLYPPVLFPVDTLDTLSSVKKLRVPVLILHGGLDPVVPVQHGETLFAVANEPKSILVLKGAEHSDMTRLFRKEFVEAVRSFVEAYNSAIR
jgi:uncharacterized protein